MAQTYTLEEAAQRLGITPETLKRRLKEDWKSLRAFRDGPTLRFRTSDVDELARSLGEVSDPSLQLAPLELPTEPPASGEFQLPPTTRPAPPKEEPIFFDGTDPFTLSLDDPAPAAGGKAAKPDSDVRLDEIGHKSSGGKSSGPLSSDEIDLDLDLAGPGSAIIREGSAARLTGPKSSTKLSASDSNKNLGKANLSDSSEFELSLDADSDDFELQINSDSSGDEVILGEMPSGPKKGGDSGINLRDPKDSGINLEKKKGPNSGIRPNSGVKLGKAPPKPDESDLDFELSLDAPTSGSATKLGGGPKSGKLPPISDSDSEFELTLDDPSGSNDSLTSAALSEDDNNDIFETDFEIPAIDDGEEAGSEAVVLEDSDTDLESSDFDLALDSSDIEAEDESGSEVVVLDDDSDTAEPVRPARRRGAAAVEEDSDVDLAEEDVEVAVDDEDEDSAAGALAGVKPSSRFDEDDDEDDDETQAVPAGAVRQVPWGPLPAIFLMPAFLIMLIGSLASYELLRSMWGYHQPQSPSTPLLKGMAEMFDMDVKGS